MAEPNAAPVTASEIGRLGGKARQALLTPEERKAGAIKAAKARWKKWRQRRSAEVAAERKDARRP